MLFKKKSQKRKPKGKKQRVNKGIVFISFIIVVQAFLLITGYRPGSHNSQQSQSKPNNQQVDKNITANLSSGKGYIHLDNFSPSAYGSYARVIPPLDTNLRPYYQIATIVNVQPKKISQQFAVFPTNGMAPPKIQQEMAKTHLPIMTREFYASGTNSKTISNKHGTLEAMQDMKFNRLYDSVNETEHFWGHPYVVPPKSSSMTNIYGTFSGGNLISQGYVFKRINNEEAMSMMERSSNGNLKLMGY